MGGSHHLPQSILIYFNVFTYSRYYVLPSHQFLVLPFELPKCKACFFTFIKSVETAFFLNYSKMKQKIDFAPKPH